MQKQRRALILYATMTKNTEKIAKCFQETFLAYGWQVNMYRLYAKSDWAAMQPNCYFDDYDVVCLGSPIVAGGLLTIVTKLFSLGGGSCGKEFGPAGLEKGEKPRCKPSTEIAAPMIYDLPDGTQAQGSFFFHHAMWDKPSPRDEMKAKALIADFVEDYFLTNDGERRPYGSEYSSIS